MSLIQEALKRRDEQNQVVPEPQTGPYVMSAEPAVPNQETKKPWLAAVGGLGLVVLLLVVVVTILAFRTARIPEKTTAQPESPATIEVAVAQPVQPPPTVAEPQPVAPRIPVKTAPPPVEDLAMKEAGKGGVLEIAGVMANLGPRSYAMINGEFVDVGKRIGGATLVEVQQGGVLFDYKGKRTFVRVGKTFKLK